jgi:hypothetical protein
MIMRSIMKTETIRENHSSKTNNSHCLESGYGETSK